MELAARLCHSQSMAGRHARAGAPSERPGGRPAWAGWRHLGLRLGRVVSLVLFVPAFWLGRALFVHEPRHVPTGATVTIVVGLVLTFALATVVHEFGHALAVRLAGQRVLAIHLGSPPALVTFRLGTVPVSVGLRLHGHVAHHFMPAGRSALVAAAGPAANLLSVPLFLLLPLPHWQAASLAVVTAISGVAELVPARCADGRLTDGARLLLFPAERRAEADVRALLERPDWSAQPDAADRLLNGYRLSAAAAEDRILELKNQPEVLLRLYAQDWTLPGAPDERVRNAVHHLSWRVLAMPGQPAELVDAAARRVEWVLEHLEGETEEDGHQAALAAVRHTLAVARLRQGRPAEVRSLCADSLAADQKPAERATVLATVAMARHALLLSGRDALDEAVALDPGADLVAEAVTALAGDPALAS
jgi:hypothetical protein